MQSPVDAPKLPLKVDSSVRFAVIGPGKPYPTVLITTEQGASELVGYYSLRELGMQKLLEIEGRSSLNAFDFLFYHNKGSETNLKAPIGSIDVWTDDGSERQQLYSLIFQSNAINRGHLDAPPEVTNGLEIQVRSIAKAHKFEDYEAIRYAAQILTTILGLIEGRASRRREQKQDFFRVFSWTFFFLVGTASILALLPLAAIILKLKVLSP